MKYVAFLRGINVGGNKKVPMAELKKALEKAGFTSVQTLLASGNIILESSAQKTDKVQKNIEAVVEKTFGFSSATTVRTLANIEKLVEKDPFAKVKVDTDTRLYVTFISSAPNKKIQTPWVSENKDYTILTVTKDEVCSVLQLKPNSRTVDSMKVLEEQFGKEITTRNWNTIQKLVTK